ncbi:MAG: aldehyde dehydrogenase [Acholeplasmataceae bacterium]
MNQLLDNQKTFYQTNQTRSYKFRKDQLLKLKNAIKQYENELKEALYKDLNKSSFEAYTTEIGFTLHSITNAVKHLKKWMKIKKQKTPIFMFGTKSYVMPEPYGQVLIIAPYNYPVQLVLEPLVGVIAAGNTCVIKPSEYASEVEKVLVKMITNTFDKSYIAIVTGDYTVTSELLDHRFDYIFFTGSTRVGQIVYEKASKYLTPVTLELGGKSPTIVDETANLKKAVSSIAFGKFMNAGQTCIAPDYIYIHESKKDEFIDLLKIEIEKRYGNAETFGHIIHQGHFKRLINLIDQDKVVYGNQVNSDKNYISPTILTDVTLDDKVMKEEIFGPILPILTFKNIDEVIHTLKNAEKPLALYIFSKNKTNIQKMLNELSFGGGAVNDTIMHVSNGNMPFGGVGQSGMGSYHGKTSFDTFSHMKSYVSKKIHLTLAYPPYSQSREKMVKKFLK